MTRVDKSGMNTKQRADCAKVVETDFSYFEVGRRLESRLK